MKVYGVGRIAKDFYIDYTDSGICFLKFPFVENVFNKKTKEKKPQYYNVVVFGKLAETMGNLDIKKGDKIGVVNVFYGNKNVEQVDLIAGESIAKKSFLTTIFNSLSFLFENVRKAI